MRKATIALLAGAGLALAAGTAAAAERLRTIQVALPDGSVAEIAYAGKVAPRIEVVPADAAAYDPFAEIERISAVMQARHEAMMRQMAALQQQAQAAAAEGRAAPGQVLVSGTLPAGSHFSYTMVSTTSGGNGCTQTVQYSSDGGSAQPKVVRTSSGDCSAVTKNAAPVQVSAPAKPAAPTVPVATPVVGQTQLPSHKT